MACPLIRVDALRRDFFLGDIVVPALRGVSLDIEQGEYIAVMGPSGSGKSTFMNLIGLLDHATGGRLLFSGEDVLGMDTDRLAALRNRAMGFVFQNFNLLPRASALENVELPLLYAGIPPAERHRRAREQLERVGLGQRMDHFPRQLSGGQQQRVAIARALVNQPSLILADEPTGALDSQTSLELMTLFRDLNAAGITLVLVTHEADIARFARRVITFRDGLVVSDERAGDTSRAADEMVAT